MARAGPEEGWVGLRLVWFGGLSERCLSPCMSQVSKIIFRHHGRQTKPKPNHSLVALPCQSCVVWFYLSWHASIRQDDLQRAPPRVTCTALLCILAQVLGQAIHELCTVWGVGEQRKGGGVGRRELLFVLVPGVMTL